MIDDEDKTEQAIYRAGQVEALLRNEMLQEAFEALEVEYQTAWLTSDAHEAQKRERLYQAISVVRKVKRHLRKILDDGKLAQADLELRERMRRIA